MPQIKNTFIEDNINKLTFERYTWFYTYYNAFTMVAPSMRGNIVEAFTSHSVGLQNIDKGINKEKLLKDWENLKYGVFLELEGCSLLSKAVECLTTTAYDQPFEPTLEEVTRPVCEFYPFEALSICRVASETIRRQIDRFFPQEQNGVLSLEERLYLGYDTKLLNGIDLTDLELIKELDINALINERYVFGYNLKDTDFVNPNAPDSVLNRDSLMQIFSYIAKEQSLPLSKVKGESVFDVLTILNRKKE